MKKMTNFIFFYIFKINLLPSPRLIHLIKITNAYRCVWSALEHFSNNNNSNKVIVVFLLRISKFNWFWLNFIYLFYPKWYLNYISRRTLVRCRFKADFFFVKTMRRCCPCLIFLLTWANVFVLFFTSRFFPLFFLTLNK